MHLRLARNPGRQIPHLLHPTAPERRPFRSPREPPRRDGRRSLQRGPVLGAVDAGGQGLCPALEP